MQKHHVALLGLLEEADQVIDFDLLGDGIVVGILLELEPRTGNDVLVVGPGGGRNQNRSWQLLLDELEADAKSSSSRNRLSRTDSAFLQDCRIFPENQILTSLNVPRDPVDRDVLLSGPKSTMLRELSAISCCSTFLTTEKTTGLRSSSL